MDPWAHLSTHNLTHHAYTHAGSTPSTSNSNSNSPSTSNTNSSTLSYATISFTPNTTHSSSSSGNTHALPLEVATADDHAQLALLRPAVRRVGCHARDIAHPSRIQRTIGLRRRELGEREKREREGIVRARALLVQGQVQGQVRERVQELVQGQIQVQAQQVQGEGEREREEGQEKEQEKGERERDYQRSVGGITEMSPSVAWESPGLSSSSSMSMEMGEEERRMSTDTNGMSMPEDDFDELIIPKVESPGEEAGLEMVDTHRLVEVSPATVKRPRGRPRKHPVLLEPANKITKGRSKTGCITCRKRKKKCDEAKPRCKFSFA